VSLWLALLPAAALAAPPLVQQVRAYRVQHEKQIVAGFVTLLSMPNVATTVTDVERNAAYIEAQLKARGFTTRILAAAPETPPAIFAELRTPGARRTV